MVVLAETDYIRRRAESVLPDNVRFSCGVVMPMDTGIMTGADDGVMRLFNMEVRVFTKGCAGSCM